MRKMTMVMRGGVIVRVGGVSQNMVNVK